MAVVRRLVFACLIACVGWIVAPAWGLPGEATPTEYELKAIFVFNFTKYVAWPEGEASGSAIRLCVLGADPFGRALDDAIEGETVQGRPLVARRLGDPKGTKECDLVWISRSEEGALAGRLAAVPSSGVLTVSDIDDFAERGGMIGLRTEQSRIHLVINEAAAENAGLRISSQLLKLARIVDAGSH